MRFETYRKGLAAYATTLLFSNLVEYQLNITGFTITHAVLALSVASLPLLACLPSARAWPWAVTGWCCCYMLILVLWLFRPSLTMVAMDQFRWRVLAVSFLMLMTLIFGDGGARSFTGKLIILTTLISVIINLFELFNPETFSTVKGRSAGLYQNANRAGAALNLGMIIGLGAINRRWWVPFAIATGLGILVTFSRSAIVGWAFTVLLVFAMNYRVKDLVRYGLIAGLFGMALVPVFWSSLLRSLEDRGILNNDVMGRVSLEVGGGVQAETDESRMTVAVHALEIFADHPILGLGTGAAYEPPFDGPGCGPHNEYLLLMVDYGLLGLFILPALVWATTWGAGRETRAIAIPFAVFITYWGLFSHNILEEYFFLLVFALVASLVAADRTRESVTPGGLR
jgi:hypothetical protein